MKDLKPQEFSSLDHDLLVRLDTNVEAMRLEMKTYTGVQSQLDVRIRNIENAVTILSPSPGSPSHAELVSRIGSMQTIIDTQAKKITTLEGSLQKYVPDYVNKIDKNTLDIEDLQRNRSYILGGWKAMAILIGGAAWMIGMSIAMINIIYKIH